MQMESLDCFLQFSSKTAGYWSGQREGVLMRKGEGAESGEIKQRRYEEREKGFGLTVWILLCATLNGFITSRVQQVNTCRDLFSTWSLLMKETSHFSFWLVKSAYSNIACINLWLRRRCFKYFVYVAANYYFIKDYFTHGEDNCCTETCLTVQKRSSFKVWTVYRSFLYYK